MYMKHNFIAVSYWGYKDCILQTVTLDQSHSCTIMLSIILENKYDEIAKMEFAPALNDNIMTAEILYDFELAFVALLQSVIKEDNLYSIYYV